MKTTTEHVTWCNTDELEKLIQDVYGVTFDIIGIEDLAPQGMRNVYEVSSVKAESWEKEDLRKFLKGGEPYGNTLELLLKDLCRKGKIPAGIVLMHAEY